MPERAFDVVVIGAGLAGLAAGARASEMGLTVAVLEKGATSEYLCNSRISGGVFHVAHEDVTKPAADLIVAIRKDTGGAGDPALAEALASGIGPATAWLQRLGATFIRSGEVANNTLLAAPPRPAGEPLDWMTSWGGRGPDALIRMLARTLQEHGGLLVLGTQARTLIMDAGSCVGVEATSADGPVQYRAHSVVIADGGFQAAPDLVRDHIAPRPEGLCRRNAGTGVGDGLRMAQVAGAGITSLKGFYGHVLSRDAIRNPRLSPYPTLDEVCVKGVIVDRQGRRFCDEGRGGVFIANAIAARDDPLETTVVCDSIIWDPCNMRRHVSAPNPALERLGGTVYSAGTISELAAAAGLPAAELEATVAKYNAFVEGATAAEPPRTRGKYKAMPIAVPPFHAIPACAGITYTMGGIRINANAQVLDRSGVPIPGLYAAGSTVGGVDVGDQAIYVGGLSKALVFGKAAAEHIGSRHSRPVLLRPDTRPEPGPAATYPALALVARHGGSIGVVAALVPIFLGGLAALQFTGGLQVVLAIAGLVLGAISYFAVRVAMELIRLVMKTLLPAAPNETNG